MFIALGVAPVIAVPTIAAGGAIGALAAIVQNALDDDWADTEVFDSHARDIHAAMLAIQCIVGGAQSGAPLISSTGVEICAGGTKPTCPISGSMLNEWRTLRDGFGKFWGEVMGFGRLGNPSNAEAKRLKDYALSFYDFYTRLQVACPQSGLKPLPKPQPAAEGDGVKALRYGAWIVGGVATIVVGKLLYDVFKR